MKDVLSVPDLTKEDVTCLLAKYIGTYAETKEQENEDQQFVKYFMPEIIEKIEHHMQDFLLISNIRLFFNIDLRAFFAPQSNRALQSNVQLPAIFLNGGFYQKGY